MKMEGDGCFPSGSSSSGTGTLNPGKSSTTSPAKAKVNIGIGIIPPPALGGGGGCSEAASIWEGKRLKTESGEGVAVAIAPSSGVRKAKSEQKVAVAVAGGRGSEMPPVREQLHPLHNPVILAHLFERCPPALLAKCRLVSKQWLKLSLTSWRATAQLCLIHIPRDFMDNPENKGGWGRKPHRKMKLAHWWIHDLSKEPVQSFWNRVGRSLTSLELANCVFPQAEDLRKIIFGTCPNLKRLSLRCCTFLKPAPVEDIRELKYLEPHFGEQTNLRVFSFELSGGDPHFRLPIHWLELLSHFPKLTTLKVSLKWGFFHRNDSVHEELLKAIEIIRQRDSKKLCLRTLELDPWLQFPHPDFSRFEGIQLPLLQSLEIEVDSKGQPGNPLLEDVLNRHRDTLLRITTVSRGREYDPSHGFHYLRDRDLCSWGFPCNVMLEKLEELRIHMLCPSKEFLKNTPKLKKLEFLEAPGYEHSKEEETRFFPEPERTALLEVRLLHLTEFRMDYRVTSDDITIFARMMPNVTKLMLSLNDKLFSAVCHSWGSGSLKEMEVLGKDLTDQGVTGLDGEGKKIACTDITSLQSLESFKFWNGNLTDRSVFNGFLKLPSFKVLEVCDDHVMPLDEAARKSLQDKSITFRGNYEHGYEHFVGLEDDWGSNRLWG